MSARGIRIMWCLKCQGHLNAPLPPPSRGQETQSLAAWPGSWRCGGKGCGGNRGGSSSSLDNTNSAGGRLLPRPASARTLPGRHLVQGELSNGGGSQRAAYTHC
eukprot:1230354-Heterocapsa_arctica.AAC.2